MALGCAAAAATLSAAVGAAGRNGLGARRAGAGVSARATWGAVGACGGRVGLVGVVGDITAGAGVGGSAAARATWVSAVACRSAVVALGCGPWAWLSFATGEGRVASAKVLEAIVRRGVCRCGVGASGTSVGGSSGVGAAWRAICTELGCGWSAGVSAAVCCGNGVSVRVRGTEVATASAVAGSGRVGVGALAGVTALAAVATSGRFVARVRWLGTDTGAWANSGCCCVRN